MTQIKRKRGRPSKADIEERARLEAEKRARSMGLEDKILPSATPNEDVKSMQDVTVTCGRCGRPFPLQCESRYSDIITVRCTRCGRKFRVNTAEMRLIIEKGRQIR